MIVLIDNYDSFSYNVYQLIGSVEPDIKVVRNDEVTIEELEANTGKTYDKLYIVGGGAKNTFLNRLTREATGKKVIALPIEATAIGNLKIQLEGLENEQI